MRPIPSAPCLALIHAFEQGPKGGFAPTPYPDPGGLLTIGWGHLIKPGETFPVPIDEAKADALALADLTTAATGVSSALLPAVLAKLTDGQYAACIDFAYNLGVGAFRGSTLCHLVNAGNFALVPDAFRKWVYGRVNGVETVLQGLVRRRNAEVDVWLS
jgi:lysozyme